MSFFNLFYIENVNVTDEHKQQCLPLDASLPLLVQYGSEIINITETVKQGTKRYKGFSDVSYAL